MDKTVSLAGQFLLAMPGMGDPRFDHAVIAMCVHDENGALGIGIGHVVDGISLHDLMDQLDIEPHGMEDRPIYHGGPVEPQRGFVLHSTDWQGEGSLLVGKGWALTSTLDILRAIAEEKGPRRYLVAMGYAGWADGQLDEEMTRHGWFATPGSDDLIFDTPCRERWTRGFADAGIDARLLASTTGTA